MKKLIYLIPFSLIFISVVINSSCNSDDITSEFLNSNEEEEETLGGADNNGNSGGNDRESIGGIKTVR